MIKKVQDVIMQGHLSAECLTWSRKIREGLLLEEKILYIVPVVYISHPLPPNTHTQIVD